MAHNKDRSRVSVADVDWDDPRLKGLLDKAEGLSIDQRSAEPGVDVTIRIAGGWEAGGGEQHALLVAHVEDLLVLATNVPLPHGSEVRVTGVPDAMPDTRWAVVTHEREGIREEDKGKGIFLNWLGAH